MGLFQYALVAAPVIVLIGGHRAWPYRLWLALGVFAFVAVATVRATRVA